MQNKQTDAVVTGTRQTLCQVYEAEQALCRGTLFPELDKPLGSMCYDRCPCAIREQAYDFAAWELRLYLNTHPCDRQALKLYRQHCAKMNGQGYAAIDTCEQKRPHHRDCDDRPDCAPRQDCTTASLRTYACENDIAFTRKAREDGFIPVEDNCRPAEESCAPAECWTWNAAPWPWETCTFRKEG